jgi:tetratricopeptide (TPR) repeat protein
MSGYEPFGVYERLLDSIYTRYNIPEKTKGYPSLQERKLIALEGEKKVSEMYSLFLSANFLTNIGEYAKANILNKNILMHFPSREIYNNIGVNNLLQVLDNVDKMMFPFALPIEIDAQSRLSKPILRSIFSSNEEEMEYLLEDAKLMFEEAIRKDRSYLDAHVNLSMVYLLQENYEGCIGKLNEVKKISPKENNHIDEIKGIAYFLNKQQEKALNSIHTFQKKDTTSSYNGSIIQKGYPFYDNKIELIEWIEETSFPIAKKVKISINETLDLPANSKNKVRIVNGPDIAYSISKDAISITMEYPEYFYQIITKKTSKNSDRFLKYDYYYKKK